MEKIPMISINGKRTQHDFQLQIDEKIEVYQFHRPSWGEEYLIARLKTQLLDRVGGNFNTSLWNAGVLISDIAYIEVLADKVPQRWLVGPKESVPELFQGLNLKYAWWRLYDAELQHVTREVGEFLKPFQRSEYSIDLQGCEGTGAEGSMAADETVPTSTA